MVKREIVFFPVPLGRQMDPQNLHGLASGTGGVAIRVNMGENVSDAIKRLELAVSAPILYPRDFQLPQPLVQEFYPTKLPPLRADAPTLMVGRLTKPVKTLEIKVDGKVADKPVSVTVAEPVNDAELDNFFLVGLVHQWKNAKDQPALIQADRALVFAADQTRLLHEELLVKGQWALRENQPEAAKQWFKQAKQIAPHDVEADAGLRIVAKLREGKLTRKQLKKTWASPRTRRSASKR